MLHILSFAGGDNAELFRNRKLYFSINVQAVCDTQLRFRDIVARWPGSSHDSTIFNASYIKNSFEQGRFGDAVLLVDGGYNNRPYLLAPIPLPGPINPAEQLYQESQIRSRNVVERMFGVWKRRFPVLALGIRVNLERALPIIVATAVLHNVLRGAGEPLPPDDPALQLPAPWLALLEEGHIPHPINYGDHRERGMNDHARRQFINYFAT